MAFLVLLGNSVLSCNGVAALGFVPQPNAHVAQDANPAASATPTVGSPTAIPTKTPPPGTAQPQPTAAATSTPVTPLAPAAPAPEGSRRPPAGEMDAASNVIPFPKAGMPKGPRKPNPARLIIPSIAVDTKVIELGTHYNEQGDLVWDTAPFAAGHHVGTPNPGEQGNVVISGHISSIHEGSVFKRLPEIKVGTGIVVVSSDRNYLYQVVEKKVVEPTQIEVMNSIGGEQLTIITCVPDGVYTHRQVVSAKRI